VYLHLMQDSVTTYVMEGLSECSLGTGKRPSF
jgi:hypothetical protein